MSYLILVRHGESRWNIANKFTGWVDVPLSVNGIKEALQAAKKLEGLRLDIAFTSELERAQATLSLILAKQDYTGIFLHTSKKRNAWAKHIKLEKHEILIHSTDRINERYYGKLQGMNKNAARRQFGKETVLKWRRSWAHRPPGGESLRDTYQRSVRYFKQKIMPHIKKNKNVIIAAHGNSLRAIIKYLDNIPNDQIPHLNLPTGMPIVYKCVKGKLIKKDHTHSFDRKVYWSKPRKL